MARTVIAAPLNNAQELNTGDSIERGVHPKELVDSINTMTSDLYGAVAAGAKYTKNTTVGATVAAAGDLTGAFNVVAEYSAVGAAALTTRTAAQMFADAGAVVGQSYEVEIMNSSAGTTTLTAGTGVTLTGTMTIAAGTARWFVVTFNSATTLTIQNVGSGSI